MTREALAQRVAYSAEMVRKIENDERTPSPKAAALLAAALEIPANQLDEFLKVARRERAVDRLGPPLTEEPIPWQAPGPPRTNLPLPPTLLVGREPESARLATLLEDPACRLVSLVGLAGIGKTRLALHAARGQLERFPHGVYFVSLAPLTTPALIASAIAQTLHVQFHETAELQEELLHYLRERRVLLVLDNFEHLVEGARLLAALLEAAPGIKLLATSRERLNLRGEWVLELEGLTCPADADDRLLNDLNSYGAVQLFMQSALRVSPSFTLDEDNRSAVARICRLTQGMPLAIELAAAWIPVLTCKTIAQEIETNLDFLNTLARDLPERQRSLRATLDHSWDLLSAREQACLQRLSVFRGGFGRKSAQAVAEAGLKEVTALLNKSLLKRVGEDRYDMHELVRQYAAAHLAADPRELSGARERHSRHYAEQCWQWGVDVTSSRQTDVLADMGAEMDNVRQAWDWMVSHQQTTQVQQSLRALWFFHEMQGLYQAGADLLAQGLAGLQPLGANPPGVEAEQSVVLAQVMARLGYFYGHLGRYGEARQLFQHGLARLRAGADQAALADALAYLGHMHLRLGEPLEANQNAEASLALHRAQGNQVGTVFCLVTLSFIALAQKDYKRAYHYSRESLSICRDRLDYPFGASNSLLALSTAASGLGRHAEAQRWAEESLALSRRLGNRWGIGQGLRRLGSISLALGQTERAEALFRQAVTEFGEIGDRPFRAWALADLGLALHSSGSYVDSQPCFLEALQIAMDTRTHDLTLHVLVELAAAKTATGSFETAYELIEYALQYPSAYGEVSGRAGRLRADLLARLSAQQVEAVRARIRARPIESLAQE